MVCARLAQDAGHFPDLVPTPLETTGLDARDAALAHAIHDAAIRRWWTLQALIAPGLTRPFLELEPRVRAALLAGAAQLVLLDRVPAHAAISESVEWAKRVIRPGAGGMVNAVLRRVHELVGEDRAFRERWGGGVDEIPLGDGRSLALAASVLPGDPVDRLSAATSIPRPLLDSWETAHGRANRDRLALHSLVTAPVVINARHATGPVPETSPHRRAGFLVYEGRPASLGALLGSRRDIWVQDPASAEAVESVRDLEPRVIVDVCAGMGTKTRQLAAVFPGAEIIASDVDRSRLETLTRVFAGNEKVRVLEPDAMLHDCLGRADLILLDVPCSNTGVLARRPEAKYRAATRQGARLVETQRQIMADSIRLLAPRGSFLYSTCSLQREENRAQADWAGKWHGFRRERERETLCGGVPGDGPEVYHDGSYSVLLRRTG